MNIEQLLGHAEQKCLQKGGRFTQKRKQILQILLIAPQPLSAYEIVDQYNDGTVQSIAPMSVYRILDFLLDMTLIHKLNASGKYAPCSHLSCSHPHSSQYFVICDKCGQAKELSMDSALSDALTNAVKESGYILVEPQFELKGRCSDCQSVT